MLKGENQEYVEGEEGKYITYHDERVFEDLRRRFETVRNSGFESRDPEIPEFSTVKPRYNDRQNPATCIVISQVSLYSVLLLIQPPFPPKKKQHLANPFP
jgi:hypothetical protein